MAGEDSLRILISAILKSDSIPTIEKQLKELKVKYGDMTIDVKIDKTVLDTLSKFNSNINQVTDSLNKETSSINKQTEATNKAIQAEKTWREERQKTVKDGAGSPKSVTTTYGNNVDNSKQTVSSLPDGSVRQIVDTTNALKDVKDYERILDQAYKDNDNFDKRVIELDKVHYQALKSDADREEALDKMHYMALKQNKEMYVKDLSKLFNDQESMDRAHYQALKTDQDRFEAQDKQHYLALQKNAEFDSKQSIAQSKLGTNVGASPKFGLDFKEAQEYAKSLTGVDAELRSVGYSINAAGEKLQTLNIQTKEGGKYQKDWTATLNQATGQTHLFEKGLSDVAQRQLGIAEKFKTMAQSIPLWMIGMTGFMSTLHFFTEGIKYVAEFNNTLTQIGTAVNYSQDKLTSLGQSFQALGKELNASTKDVAAGALEFYRQGLGDEQVLERLKTTTMYAKISGLEFKQSAELLTAASTSMHTDINKVADTFTLLGKQNCPLAA